MPIAPVLTTADLEIKPDFQCYTTSIAPIRGWRASPKSAPGEGGAPASLRSYHWQSHFVGFITPMARRAVRDARGRHLPVGNVDEANTVVCSRPE